ncbi:RagB/SusD family nutrient uptake outer membrane protein [Sphingobacterium sp. LRF_L2]|uniref:RagB/SusD family nutrient uptake outer membrane protein n=1 Tax=Sphingobacterium sp. LRF_L2 TaxID=3369421 RepID=UPI003F63980F
MKKIHVILLLIVFAASFSSCSKWLDLQPQDGITKDEYWQTKEDVRAALYGIYSSLNSGSVEARMFLWGEIRADMVDVTTYASDDYRFAKNVNILSTNTLADWAAVYSTINDCNLLIDFAKDAKALDPTFSDAEYNSYLGEALTVRSLLYFYLVRTFRDIPLKLKGSYKDSDALTPTAQVTPEETITQLISDLKQAQGLVPDYHEEPEEGSLTEAPINKGRVTKPAVTALLADVYLWNEDYALAEAEADKILSTERYTLIGQASTLIYQGNSSETIFEISHDESVMNILMVYVRYLNPPLAANTTFINDQIFTPNMEVDVSLRDTRADTYTAAGSIIRYGSDYPSYYSTQIYRISDVMLIKADALNEQGRGEEALAILEELRTQRQALAATDPGLDPDDVGGIGRFILAERAREFAFEGKRWFDLLRYAKRDNYANIDVLIELVGNTADVSVQQAAISKIRQIDSHYLPIPQSEINTDPLLKQNPFYLN